MYGCRSMRRLRPDPVPDELLARLVEVGTRAPSAANAQNWRSMIVDDHEAMRRIAEPWRRDIALLVGSSERVPARPVEDLDQRRRTLAAVTYLAEHFPNTPALYPSVWKTI
jgi:nitroreductase